MMQGGALKVRAHSFCYFWHYTSNQQAGKGRYTHTNEKVREQFVLGV